MARTLKTFSGRGSYRNARDYAGREFTLGGTQVGTDTWRDGLGRIIGVRQGGGDTYAVVELTQIEGLQARLAFCRSEAQRHADHAAGWPAAHPLAAANWRDNARWLAEAETVSAQIEAAEAAEKGRAA